MERGDTKMANITHMTLRFSGVVAYSDNTTGVFHSGSEGTESNYILWSIDQNTSIENLKQVSWSTFGAVPSGSPWPFWGAIITALSSFNFMNMTWDTDHPTIQKDIISMAGRFDLVAAFDDNTTASAAVTATGNVNSSAEMVTVEDAAIALADNIVTVRLGIRTLLNYVMDEVTVSA